MFSSDSFHMKATRLTDSRKKHLLATPISSVLISKTQSPSSDFYFLIWNKSGSENLIKPGWPHSLWSRKELTCGFVCFFGLQFLEIRVRFPPEEFMFQQTLVWVNLLLHLFWKPKTFTWKYELMILIIKIN